MTKMNGLDAGLKASSTTIRTISADCDVVDFQIAFVNRVLDTYVAEC